VASTAQALTIAWIIATAVCNFDDMVSEEAIASCTAAFALVASTQQHG
jgi:hypothetical protein